jgi:hypothetical protein
LKYLFKIHFLSAALWLYGIMPGFAADEDQFAASTNKTVVPTNRIVAPTNSIGAPRNQSAGITNSSAFIEDPRPADYKARSPLENWYFPALVLVIHFYFWILVLLLYPRSRLIQEGMVWNPSMRRVLGFFYIDILLVAIPLLRRRLLIPFRQSLLRPIEIEGLSERTYYANRELSPYGSKGGEKLRAELAFSRLSGQRVIQGATGVGKTMLLRHLAKINRKPVALLQAVECEKGVVAGIAARLQPNANDEDFLRRIISAGGLDILIDAFDEAPVETQKQIEQFVEQASESNIVLATRSLSSGQFASVRTYTLEPLRQDEIEAFLLLQWHKFETDALITKEAYEQRVNSFARQLRSQASTSKRAEENFQFIRNPFEALFAAELIADGRDPDIGAVVEENYKAALYEYRTEEEREFPLAAFSNRIQDWRKSDAPNLDITGFEREVQSLRKQKIMILRYAVVLTSDGEKGESRWRFRNDKVREFFSGRAPASQILQGKQDDRSVLPPPQVPEELIKACVSGECVLFAGAGLSAQAGLPTWSGLLHEAVDLAIEQKAVDQRFGESLRVALQQGELESVSEGLLAQLGSGRYILYEFLRKRLLEKTVLSNVHEILRDVPFSAVLTTNLDRLLEATFSEVSPRALVYTSGNTETLLTALSSRAFFILKLYGDLDSPDTVILSATQYEDAIASNRSFSIFMETLFFSRTLLFIGAQLDGIEDYLRGIKFSETRPRTHFALIDVTATGSTWELKANSLRRKYGIEVIPYTPSEGHPQVPKFVKTLREGIKIAQKVQQTAMDSGITPVPGRGALKRLVLDNIGPFDHLELELNSGWNVLLGDNGVGKSNILRAIAMAVCGRDAQRYANRLIKADRLQGTILIETDRGTLYKTKISRGSVEAEVTCEPGRPLEAEGWLALGFPPSRLLTWDRPKSPDARVERRPSPEDILPIVTGVSDPRMDKLKQWLVNLDYWIKDAREKGQDFHTYERLRDEFFEVVGKLAIGTKLKYQGIDPKTYEVKIETNDGLVPLESVSQGTASLIGWVGILLQRLYETPLANTAPLDRYALVLIDEIDAHMHPRWQRSIVDTLKEMFPNVQFIATSHSPLIVAGLKKSEIYTVRRQAEPGLSGIIAERPPFDPQGWYADIVLTSDLFKLESTLPPKLAEGVKRYTELAARNHEDLSPLEQEEMSKLAVQLNIRMPRPQERQDAREAFELLSSAMDDRLKDIPIEKQRELMAEAKVQLQEIITQSRRP